MTNWEAVYAVIERKIDDELFTGKVFHLLKFVYDDVKAMPDAEERLRTKAQRVIQCLDRIHRQNEHVNTIDYLVFTILNADEELKLVNQASVNLAKCYCVFISCI